jgi:hypothetical protein
VPQSDRSLTLPCESSFVLCCTIGCSYCSYDLTEGSSVRTQRGREADLMIHSHDTFPSLHSDSNEDNPQKKRPCFIFPLQPQAEQVVTVKSSLKNCLLTVCLCIDLYGLHHNTFAYTQASTLGLVFLSTFVLPYRGHLWDWLGQVR